MAVKNSHFLRSYLGKLWVRQVVLCWDFLSVLRELFKIPFPMWFWSHPLSQCLLVGPEHHCSFRGSLADRTCNQPCTPLISQGKHSWESLIVIWWDCHQAVYFFANLCVLFSFQHIPIEAFNLTQKGNLGAGEVAQVVECLLTNKRPWVQTPVLKKRGRDFKFLLWW
jgi:hypothetical protein